jgi:hypothetical protein
VDGRCTPPALHPERLPEQALKPGRRAALEALRVVKTSRPTHGRVPLSTSGLSFPLPSSALRLSPSEGELSGLGGFALS